MAHELAEKGTHLRYVQDLLARAYDAMSEGGSNDAEHDVLYEFVQLAEDEIRKMGGDLPKDPGWFSQDDDEEGK